MPNALQRQEMQRGQGDQSDTFLAFAQQWSVSLDAALTAAGEVYVEAVKAKLSRGYTSGEFAGETRFGVTGAPFPGRTVAGSVRQLKPQFDKNGLRVVMVGSNNFIARMWEFGHHNFFTKRYERVEHWRMAMLESGEQMAQSFHGVFDTVLGNAPRVPRVGEAA